MMQFLPSTHHRRLLLSGIIILITLFATACARGLAELAEQPIPTVAFTPPPLPSRSSVITSTVTTPDVQTTPVPGTELIGLTTEEQIAQVVVPTRDLRDLMLRLDPTIHEIPVVVNETVPDYAVGEQQEFWVHNTDTNTNLRITAELVHKTDVAYAWVEAAQRYDRDAIARSLEVFSERSYPAIVAFFGSEWYPGVDNDPRVHILHSVNMGNGVAGYYSSADEYSKLANAFSNEKEMFYINLNWLNNLSSYSNYETVLAHEFQHMIHWYNDRNEETWLNEGLSEYAQEIAGYGADAFFANIFLRQPDTQLTTWRLDSSNNAEHYGSAYLFVNYLTQRFGRETTQAVVANPGNGTQGITDALAMRNHDIDFDALFADWVIANYVEDPDALGADGRYGYRDLDLPTPPVETVTTGELATYEATVSNYATDYVQLPTGRELTIQFQGQIETRLANTMPYSGQHAWWSHRGDDSNSRLTRRFDLSAIPADTTTPVTMDVAMWWNIEVDYDYGYVLASRDAQKWEMLEGPGMTRENPSGNNFGIGYTGQSNGWEIETFDLTDYAGGELWLRFEYVTDDAVNASGWLIDDLSLPAIDYQTDFETELSGWESEGWLLTNNRLQQHWLVQLLHFSGGELTAVEQVAVDESGRARFTVPTDQAVIAAVSALAPISTEPAFYELTLE